MERPALSNGAEPLEGDVGPETDVDAVDNAETPAPLAAVKHDNDEVDNVADSDSEDEWNYYRGNNQSTLPADKSKPVIENFLEQELDEDMMASQLNPDAAEFVPVSPTSSPLMVPAFRHDNLLDDKILAQSPRKVPLEDSEQVLTLPSDTEFSSEIKLRPGETVSTVTYQESFEDFNNKENLQLTRELDIGIQPLDNGHIYNDHVSPVFSNLNPCTESFKPQDVMAMSFYQDVDSNNPFETNENSCDPNAVQELPLSDSEDECQHSKENTMLTDCKIEKDLMSPVNETQSPDRNDFCRDEILNESGQNHLQNLNNLMDYGICHSEVLNSLQSAQNEVVSFINETVTEDTCVPNVNEEVCPMSSVFVLPEDKSESSIDNPVIGESTKLPVNSGSPLVEHDLIMDLSTNNEISDLTTESPSRKTPDGEAFECDTAIMDSTEPISETKRAQDLVEEELESPHKIQVELESEPIVDLKPTPLVPVDLEPSPLAPLDLESDPVASVESELRPVADLMPVEIESNPEVPVESIAQVDLQSKSVAPQVELESESVAQVGLESESVAQVGLESEPVAKVELESEHVAKVELESEPVAKIALESKHLSGTIELGFESAAQTEMEFEPVATTELESISIAPAELLTQNINQFDCQPPITHIDIESQSPSSGQLNHASCVPDLVDELVPSIQTRVINDLEFVAENISKLTLTQSENLDFKFSPEAAVTPEEKTNDICFGNQHSDVRTVDCVASETSNNVINNHAVECQILVSSPLGAPDAVSPSVMERGQGVEEIVTVTPDTHANAEQCLLANEFSASNEPVKPEEIVTNSEKDTVVGESACIREPTVDIVPIQKEPEVKSNLIVEPLVVPVDLHLPSESITEPSVPLKKPSKSSGTKSTVSSKSAPAKKPTPIAAPRNTTGVTAKNTTSRVTSTKVTSASAASSKPANTKVSTVGTKSSLKLPLSSKTVKTETVTKTKASVTSTRPTVSKTATTTTVRSTLRPTTAPSKLSTDKKSPTNGVTEKPAPIKKSYTSTVSAPGLTKSARPAPAVTKSAPISRHLVSKTAVSVASQDKLIKDSKNQATASNSLSSATGKKESARAKPAEKVPLSRPLSKPTPSPQKPRTVLNKEITKTSSTSTVKKSAKPLNASAKPLTSSAKPVSKNTKPITVTKVTKTMMVNNQNGDVVSLSNELELIKEPEVGIVNLDNCTLDSVIDLTAE